MIPPESESRASALEIANESQLLHLILVQWFIVQGVW